MSEELLTPAHQTIADQLREEARCWPWRRQLIEHRIRELTNIQGDIESVLWQSLPKLDDPQHLNIKEAIAPGGEISAAIRQLRDVLMKADDMLGKDELDYAESACEQSEHALIELRTIGRELGVLPSCLSRRNSEPVA
jgi:hypothetical protein